VLKKKGRAKATLGLKNIANQERTFWKALLEEDIECIFAPLAECAKSLILRLRNNNDNLVFLSDLNYGEKGDNHCE